MPITQNLLTLSLGTPVQIVDPQTQAQEVHLHNMNKSSNQYIHIGTSSVTGLMPYFVTGRGEHPDCSGYAVVKQDFELMGCHDSRQDAIDQMVAISIAEGIEPGGTYTASERNSENRELPDNYRPALAEDVPEGTSLWQLHLLR
jgi:hypothetical protein